MLHITVVIKVIAAQVGEDRRGKLQRGDAVLHQAVRGNFHRGERCPLPCQARKDVLNVNSRTGGVFRWDNFPQQAIAYGSHYRTGFAKQLRPLRQQLRRGGLTVSSGDAHQAQLF